MLNAPDKKILNQISFLLQAMNDRTLTTKMDRN